MLKLGKLTDYGVLLMAEIAHTPQRCHSGAALASATQLSPTTVAKLLKMLSRAGLLMSVRGAHGGYKLALAPQSLTVLDIVRAIEGPVAVTPCTEHPKGCQRAGNCRSEHALRRINAHIQQALSAICLADITPSATVVSVAFPERMS